MTSSLKGHNPLQKGEEEEEEEAVVAVSEKGKKVVVGTAGRQRQRLGTGHHAQELW